MELLLAPKYEKYMDSGEGWIGEIPDHWTVLRLKSLFREKKHTSNMELSCGAISFGEVVHKNDEMVADSTKRSYQEVLSGEFLINPLNLNYDLISLRIALSKFDVVVSAGYIVLKEVANINKEYFKYLLHRYDVAFMKLLGSGVRQTISFNHISNSLLIYPPLEEQLSISKFLDHKCAQIDKAIKTKECLMARLKERKQVLIQHAVTRGLDTSVQMKDSGVDWIDQIPAHWEVKPIMAVSDVIDPNPSHRNPEYVEEGFPFISTQEFYGFDEIEINTPRRVSERTVVEQEARCRFQRGSLVFSRKGTIGAVRVLPEGVRLGILDSLCVINPKGNALPNFLFWALSANYLEAQYGSTLRGAALPQLSVGRVRSLKIILPSKAEQEKISSYLRGECSSLSEALAIQERQISALKEYKATLINSAVTGKIKVTGVVEPQVQDMEVA
ncbi:restriction endonuclease subunit S [Pseudomonas sp. FP2338]|uniref:restriction endonuclease subunit S n=1 Tax=Pseudomonas sp. FP2338 TaxID=2954093 RepID=UPI002732867B|nr:restriction endonuclease subunit S [Pseudomonas sp. FP2338]WLH83984.1 restriction endonuclease subunit S [Pseudomonas sp. FP2338]